MEAADFGKHWKDLTASLLKIGATAYGGPAIMGIMQAELQEKRHWVSKEHFVEGLSLVNMIPGATATQLAMFLGFARGGVWGALLAGVCFVLPGFAIMLALTVTYAALGVSPILRGALYGLGPVVLAIFLMAVYRLGRPALGSRSQVALAFGAAAAALWSPIGIVAILLGAGGAGLWLFHSRKVGTLAIIALVASFGGLPYVMGALTEMAPGPGGGPHAPTLANVSVLLLKVGAFTFGGGLTMIAFIQDQVVNQWHWLTAQEFIDGLALGQFTPGPVLMVAAYVGYKVAGLSGAAVGAAAAFLPSFVLMLALLPVFDRIRRQAWIRAAMRGIAPAVIGVLAVSLLRLAPYALPDAFAASIFAAALVALAYWRVGAMRTMLGGAALGVLRARWSLHAVRSALSAGLGARL